MGFRFHLQILTILVFDSKYSRAAGRNTNQGLSCVQQLHSTSGKHQTPHFSRSTDERELILCLTAFAFAFTLFAPRTTDSRNQGESVRPSRRKPFSANKGGRGEGEEGGGIGMGAAYRAPPNKHPREFLRAFLHIRVFCVCSGKYFSSQNCHLIGPFPFHFKLLQ